MSACRLLIALGLLLQVNSGERRYADQDGNPILGDCLIRLKSEDEIRIPAMESGVLIEMPVKEGSRVAKGALLAKIDDREATAGVKVAQFALKSAEQRATEDIEIRYAEAAKKVADADVMQSMKANLDSPGSTPGGHRVTKR